MTETNTTDLKAAYDAAVEALKAAQQKVADIKASSANVIKAFEEAKAALAAFKPSLTVAVAQVKKAEADVTIAKSAYDTTVPKEARGGAKANTELLNSVVTFMREGGISVTFNHIFDAVGGSIGGENPRANLKSYLSRWVASGKLLKVDRGVWALPVNTPTVESTASVPPWAPPANPVNDTLAENFPGLIPLQSAGFHTRSSLEGKTLEDLKAIPGIGSATAVKILEALAV